MNIGRTLRIALAACGLCTASIQAQDIHFSQFYASPLNLNPAATGVMPCDMRVSLGYRNQWASAMTAAKAFNTITATVDGKFAVPYNNGDQYGLGMTLWADKAGSSSFSTIQANFSASYLKRLTGGHRQAESYLVAGGQIGFLQRSMKLWDLMYGSQFNGTQYDGSLSSGENIGGQRVTVADVNAGLLYYCILDQNRRKGSPNPSNFYLGIGFHHLTRSNISFMNEGFESLFTKFTIHGGGEFRIQRRFALNPIFALHFQGPSVQSNFGTLVKFDLSKRAVSDQAFYVGGQMRLVSSPTGKIASDAAIAVVRLQFGSSIVGFSYDINISKLAAATRGNGAFELSYVYTLCGMRSKSPMPCPTF